MSGSIIGDDVVLFTIPDQSIIGPVVDRIEVREGTFETINSTDLTVTTVTATTVTTDTLNIANVTTGNINATGNITAAGDVTGTNVNAVDITATGDITGTNVIAATATVTTLNTTSAVVGSLATNTITATPPGFGVSIDGAIVRDQPHYAVANRSVTSIEGANPASTAGISVALAPYFTGALIGAVPDGTTAGGNTRGDNSVDWQTVRAAANQVAGSPYSTIGGGASNLIATGANFATISGGGNNSIAATAPNTAAGSIIAGGTNNTISAALLPSTSSSVIGGSGNTITNTIGSAIVGSINSSITLNSSAIISGGSSNNISGSGSYCTIAGGSGNSIVGGNSNIITAGTNNAISFSSDCTISGNSNVITGSIQSVANCTGNNIDSSNNALALGNSNVIAAGSHNSAAIGRQNTCNGEGAFAIGRNADSQALLAHTFSAYDLPTTQYTNTNPRSHKFIDSIFEVYCAEKQIFNTNTFHYYGDVTTVGPVVNFPIKFIPLEPSTAHMLYIIITGAGGNSNQAASGYGYLRCYTNPINAVGGTLYDGNTGEDGGFGFSWDVAYAGQYVEIRVTTGVLPLVKCHFTVSIQDQKATVPI